MANICIFSGSSEPKDPAITAFVTKVCQDLAADGHDLVYGASLHGLMGLSAQIFLEAGRKVIGVMPRALNSGILNPLRPGPNIELVLVENMFQRKQVFIDRSHAFITVPGGVGSLDELSEVHTHAYAPSFAPGLPYGHDKPVIMPIHNHVDQLLLDYLHGRVEQGLISDHVMSKLITGPWENCLAYLRRALAVQAAA